MVKIACLLLQLYVRREKTRLISVVWMSPCSSLSLGLYKNLMRVSFRTCFRTCSRTCSRTYCGCLRTSLRTFYDFLRTKHIFFRTIIASIYECDFREKPYGCRSFQKIFQIHIIYNNKHEYCHVFIKRLVF